MNTHSNTIVHLSDTHFGTEIPAVVNALYQTLAVIQPEVLILTGDVTQRARWGEFKKALAFMQRLTSQVKLVIPGNHDIPLFNLFARFLTPYGNFKRAFGLREPIWYKDDLAIIGYDATSPLHHIDGQLSKRQITSRIQSIKSSLAPNALLIAAVHQPLHTAWIEDRKRVLIAAEQTAQCFSENQIDLVLSGHVHVPLLTTTAEVFPNLPRHFVLSGAGTAISSRIRPGAPHSFHVIRIENHSDSRAITITHFSYDKLSQQFNSMAPVRFVTDNKGWKRE